MIDLYIEIMKEVGRENIYYEYEVDCQEGLCNYESANKEEDKIIALIDKEIA